MIWVELGYYKYYQLLHVGYVAGTSHTFGNYLLRILKYIVLLGVLLRRRMHVKIAGNKSPCGCFISKKNVEI